MADSPSDPPSCERARRVERLLRGRETPMTVGRLADELRRFSASEDLEEVPSRGDVHEDLYSRVLPRLAEAGHCRFDPTTGMVAPPADSRVGLLEQLSARTGRAPARTAATALVLGVVVVGLATGFDPLVTTAGGATAVAALFSVRLLVA